MPRVTTRKISVEYILKKMRKEFEHFIAPPKSNTKEDRNEGNEQQKAIRYIENK